MTKIFRPKSWVYFFCANSCAYHIFEMKKNLEAQKNMRCKLTLPNFEKTFTNLVFVKERIEDEIKIKIDREISDGSVVLLDGSYDDSFELEISDKSDMTNFAKEILEQWLNNTEQKTLTDQILTLIQAEVDITW